MIDVSPFMKEADVHQPPLVVLDREVRAVVPDIASNPSFAQIMQPERVAYRQSLQETVLEVYPKMLKDNPYQQTIYLAVTGTEFRALYGDNSDEVRTGNAQWKVIEALADYDARFRCEDPAYNDDLRWHVHGRIKAEYPEVKAVIDDIGLYAPMREPGDPGLPHAVRDAVMDSIYSEFPYFIDVLTAAQAENGFDETIRGSLELLYAENHFARLHAECMEIIKRVLPHQELRYDDIKKYVDTVGMNGRIAEGKLTKVLRRHAQLAKYPLPQDIFAENLGIDASVSPHDRAIRPVHIFPLPEIPVEASTS